MAWVRKIQKYEGGHWIVIPSEICHHLGLVAGDHLFVYLSSDRTFSAEKLVDLDPLKQHAIDEDNPKTISIG